MQAEERAQQSESTISMLELMCSPTLRYPLIIGIIMQLSQQLSGINAVSLIAWVFLFICIFAQCEILMRGLLANVFLIGALLFYRIVSKSGLTGRNRQIHDNRYRRDNGGNDFDYYASDGSNGSKNVASLWLRRNVHIFCFYYHFFSNESKSMRSLINVY